NLPEEQKLLYKSKCKGSNKSREKFDSRGIPLSQIQEEEEEKRMKDREMKKNIRTIVDALKTRKSLSSANFFLVHMSYYVHLANDTYVPAEIGVVQFSFAKGVTSTFHRIFPDKIPIGYHFEAITHSNETHNLLNSIAKDEHGFEEDLNKFLLKDGTKLPFLYTQNEMMESVESMLTKFDCKYNDIFGSIPLKIYSLDVLYQHLYSVSIREIPESIATHALQSSEFDYAPNISCHWHDNIAPDFIKYCSLSCCHRWVFNMCNSLRLQDTFGIIPEKGKHYPDFGSFHGVVDVYQVH
ncbi:Protein maelstrom-like protein, partial [Armadillidium nasatum]